MNDELRDSIMELLLELDGSGLVITDQDTIEDTLDSLSDFIESLFGGLK